MKTSETIAEIVKRWLRTAGKTQQDAADFLGIKQGSLSKMLSTPCGIPKERLADLIAWLSPDPDEVARVLWMHFFTARHDGEDSGAIEQFGREVQAHARQFTDDMCGIGATLNLDLSDPDTYRLLEYWRDMPTAERFRLLAELAEKDDKNTGGR